MANPRHEYRGLRCKRRAPARHRRRLGSARPGGWRWPQPTLLVILRMRRPRSIYSLLNCRTALKVARAIATRAVARISKRHYHTTTFRRGLPGFRALRAGLIVRRLP